MTETRYMISDASKQVGVEAHVLRYWEEELNLPIMRNEMGHRYYTEENIRCLKHVREMKEKGFQLKAICMAMNSQIESAEELMVQNFAEPGADANSVSEVQMTEKGNIKTERQSQARELVMELFRQVLEENNQILTAGMKEQVGDHVIKQMDYLFREQEEKEEARFKRFDEQLRKKQKTKLGLGIKDLIHMRT